MMLAWFYVKWNSPLVRKDCAGVARCGDWDYHAPEVVFNLPLEVEHVIPTVRVHGFLP